MVLKTFNVEEAVYDKFFRLCREHGVSMSKQVDLFMRSMIAEEPEVKEEYLQKLDRIQAGRFLKVKDFAKRYHL